MNEMNGESKVLCAFAWFTKNALGVKKGHVCDKRVAKSVGTKHYGKHHCHCGERK